jgi:hypothetical protein
MRSRPAAWWTALAATVALLLGGTACGDTEPSEADRETTTTAASESGEGEGEDTYNDKDQDGEPPSENADPLAGTN